MLRDPRGLMDEAERRRREQLSHTTQMAQLAPCTDRRGARHRLATLLRYAAEHIDTVPVETLPARQSRRHPG